ncbi:MAG: hypothetical protein HY720_28015 [Planctomycetes bacterium]|nr:hypothetical protein [Planctomycetota bacterium]
MATAIVRSTVATPDGVKYIETIRAGVDQTIQRSFVATAGRVVFEGLYRKESVPGITEIRLRSGTTNQARFRFRDDGNIEYFSAGAPTVAGAYAAATWYRIRVEMNFTPTPNQYAFYVDNTLIAAAAVGDSNLASVSNVQVVLSTAAHTFLADDVEVYTQKKWLGAVSTAYSNAANWIPAGVPVATDAVRITDQSLQNFDCVLDGAGLVAANLQLDDENFGPASGNFDPNGFDFTVNGAVQVDSGATLLVGGGVLTIPTAGADVSCYGTVQLTTGTLAVADTFYLVPGGSLNFGGPAESATVNANIFRQTGGTLNMNDPGDVLDLALDLNVTAGSIGPGFDGQIRAARSALVSGATTAWDMPAPAVPYGTPRVTIDGSAVGNVEMNGGTNRFGTLEILKSPVTTNLTVFDNTRARWVDVGSRFSIGGFTLTVDNDFRLKTNGDLRFSSAAGVLDIAGRFEFEQGSTPITTSAMTQGTIRVAGDFDVETTAGTENFNPTGGTVWFDGTAAQSILLDSASDSFFALTIAGVDVQLSAASPLQTLDVRSTFSVTAGNKFTVDSGQTFRLSRVKAGFPPGIHTVNGTFEMVTGTGAVKTTVQLGDHQLLRVTGAGSAFRVVEGAVPASFANAYVHFTRDGAAGGYSVHLADGASVQMFMAKFDFLYGRSNNSNEITEATIQSGLCLSGNGAAISFFYACWFDNVLDGGAPVNNRYPRPVYFIDDDADTFNGLGSVNPMLYRLRFDNSAGTAGLHNVEKRAVGANITFTNNGGTIAGESLDMDGSLDDNVTDDPDPRNTGVDEIFFAENPTAIELADLAARGFDGSALVEWRTAQEFENLGFNVYRSLFPGGGFVQVNRELVLGLGDSQTGGRYYFLDRTAGNGVRYFYLLEDVSVRGERTLHGPVWALPLAGAGEPALDAEGYTNGATRDGATAPDGSPSPPDMPNTRALPDLAGRVVGMDLAAAGIRLLSYDASGALIEILPPAPSFDAEVWGGRLLTRISMAGYASTRAPGRPVVPAKGIALVTPGILGARTRILEADRRTVTGLELVRSSPTPARVSSGSSPGGRRHPDGPPLTLLAMIEEARTELLELLENRREELLDAREKGRARLLGRSLPGGAAGEERGGTREGPASESPAGLWPGSLVNAGSLFLAEGRQLLPLAIQPVQVSLSEGTVDVYQRILVRIDFLGASVPGGEPPAAAEGLYDTPAQLALAADPAAAKIRVREDGIYRLTRDELARAGFPVGADPRNFRLYNLGAEVAVVVTGEIDGVFDEGDELLFYGTRNPWRTIDNPEATRHTDENVYWLAAGNSRGRRMVEAWVAPVPDWPPEVDHEAACHVEENLAYYPRLAQGEGRDHWFGRTLYGASGGTASSSRATFRLPALRLSNRPHLARLDVALAGVTDASAAPDHRVLVLLSGHALGEMVWDGRHAVRHSFEFPSNLLLAGENEVELRLPVDLPGVPNDMVFVNYLRLSYRRLFAAVGDETSFRSDQAGEFDVGGFESDRVIGLDVSDLGASRLLRGIQMEGGRVRFNDTVARGGGRYILAGSRALRSPFALERNCPSNWHDPANRADWIAVAHPGLLAGVEALADLRRSQGLVVALADLTDLYDEFTAGIPDPRAIRAFLAHARARWTAPAPRFVLLVGDGSFDPHGYRWRGSELLPAPLLQMEHLWSASDNWYAAVEGADELPDLSLGRLPAATQENLAVAISKIVAHETGPNETWRRRATLVADNEDGAYDFPTATRLAAGELRASYDVETLVLGPLQADAVRSGIRTAFEEGRFLVAYSGHGSATQWASENLLSSGAVPALPARGRFPLVAAMGCMNGMYHLPQLWCLGEALLQEDSRGAMAFWGSTTLADPAPQERVFRELARVLAEGRTATIGEAIGEAKARAWIGGTDDLDVVRSWVLLGDPASRLAER